MMNHGGGRGRGRRPTGEKDVCVRGRSSPSTHTTPLVGAAHVSPDDGKDNKSSGGSSPGNQLSGQLNELLVSPGTSIAIGFQQLSPVQFKKHPDGQNTPQEKTISFPTSYIPFDICLTKTGTPKLKPSLLVQNRDKRKLNHSMGGQAAKLLRPGMVLLNNFISCKDQVEIVKTCRKLGQGNGGFYQPGYGDGVTMHLKMMCLGKNWDPKTSSYGEQRPEDGAEPPPIPSEFNQLVQRAIQDTHAYLLKEVKQTNVESVLPSMAPDICIVNFYTSTGRLGLHKDKDESQESLNRGLPVVSISIGDSAEFLYGDQMDINKAEKVVLASGDVLIFGGKSRHVYHGVTSILPNTAPQALLQESDLRPGRLNLTFRQY